MSYAARNYVKDGAPMFRAVGYDMFGRVRCTLGPYSTAKAAAGQRNYLLSRPNVAVVRVETGIPQWSPVEGYEVTR